MHGMRGFEAFGKQGLGIREGMKMRNMSTAMSIFTRGPLY